MEVEIEIEGRGLRGVDLNTTLVLYQIKSN